MLFFFHPEKAWDFFNVTFTRNKINQFCNWLFSVSSDHIIYNFTFYCLLWVYCGMLPSPYNWNIRNFTYNFRYFNAMAHLWCHSAYAYQISILNMVFYFLFNTTYLIIKYPHCMALFSEFCSDIKKIQWNFYLHLMQYTFVCLWCLSVTFLNSVISSIL